MVHYSLNNWHIIGFTIGFGMVFVYSDILVPNPPANITTFIIFFILVIGTSELKHD